VLSTVRRGWVGWLVGVACLLACAGPAASPTATPTAALATARPAAALTPLTQALSTPEPTSVPTPEERDPGQLLVIAASSLVNPFQDMASAFLASTPAATGIGFNFASATEMRRLVSQGADADVLATDDRTQMDSARQSNFIDGQAQAFGRNQLVVLTPKSNPKQIGGLMDLARSGVRWVTTDPAEPTAQATLSLLDRAAADPAYGADFRTKAERNILARLGAPADAIATIVAGEADATVVYTSDVDLLTRGRVQQFDVPETLSPATDYAIAVTSGAHAQIARAFVAFVLSPRGQDILKKWGIVAPAAGG
jgi:molybdate transport system substrate-binding protein